MFGNLVFNKNINVYLGKIIMSKTPKREGNTLSQLTKTGACGFLLKRPVSLLLSARFSGSFDKKTCHFFFIC